MFRSLSFFCVPCVPPPVRYHMYYKIRTLFGIVCTHCQVEKFVESYGEEVTVPPNVPRWLWGGDRAHWHPTIRIRCGARTFLFFFSLFLGVFVCMIVYFHFIHFSRNCDTTLTLSRPPPVAGISRRLRCSSRTLSRHKKRSGEWVDFFSAMCTRRSR